MEPNNIISLLKGIFFENFFLLKRVVKAPFNYIDYQQPISLKQILVFVFLVEAFCATLFNVFTLHMRSANLITGLIYAPIQVLVFIAFLSFILSFIFERFELSNATFLQIFKLLGFAEIIGLVFSLPFLIVFYYIKFLDLFYLLSILILLAKAYLVFRGLDRQIQLKRNINLSLVAAATIILVLPALSSYRQSYQIRKIKESAQKLHEKQMEKSISELEKELGGIK